MIHPPGSRYVKHQFGETLQYRWGVRDLADDKCLRRWRGRKQTHSYWTGTEEQAESLANLLNRPAPADLGNISVVTPDFDPPTHENAKQWKIAHNRTKRSSKATPSHAFQECSQCHRMVKEPCQHP